MGDEVRGPCFGVDGGQRRGFVMMRAVLFHLMGEFSCKRVSVYVRVYFWRQLKACGQFGQGSTIDDDVFLCACICMCAERGQGWGGCLV